MIEQNSSIGSKEQTVEKFVQILNLKVTSFAQTSFYLSGYIFHQLKLPLDPNVCSEFLKCLKMMIESVNSNQLSKTNFVEILVDSLQETKSMGSRMNGPKEFISKAEKNWRELSLNRKYLREKWANQKKHESMIREYERQQMQRRRRQRQMEEKESLKYIQMLQQETDKEMQARLKMERENQEIARRLMEEQEGKYYKQRQALQNKKQQCDICLEPIEYFDLETLECRHSFHRHCIAEHIKACLREKKIQIKCPAGCGSHIPVDIIYQCCDGQSRQRYDKFCLDHYVQTNNKHVSWCPTPGCTAVFTAEEQISNYRCPICHKHYCLACRCNYHNGQTCAEYRISHSYGEDDRKFQQFVKGAKFKQCPKCNFWVERAAGCSTMTCRCGHEFCYDCGGSDCPHGACKNKGKKR